MAELVAPSRDEAFAALREQGVKPIKMVASDGSKANGLSVKRGLLLEVVYVVVIMLVAAAVAGGTWWIVLRRDDVSSVMMTTPQGPVTCTAATPLPRQVIPGDRHRVETAQKWTGGTNSVFKYAAECLLSRYAEPGRKISPDALNPTLEDFDEALKETILLVSSDFTEVVDLKRMVEGMKREMRAYLAGGGTPEEYLGELDKRQRLEISYRENAEGRLKRILAEDGNNGKPLPSARLKEAYDYWLKANALLKSMGIYEIPLPDALRLLQTTLELEE